MQALLAKWPTLKFSPDDWEKMNVQELCNNFTSQLLFKNNLNILFIN